MRVVTLGAGIVREQGPVQEIRGIIEYVLMAIRAEVRHICPEHRPRPELVELMTFEALFAPERRVIELVVEALEQPVVALEAVLLLRECIDEGEREQCRHAHGDGTGRCGSAPHYRRLSRARWDASRSNASAPASQPISTPVRLDVATSSPIETFTRVRGNTYPSKVS